MIILAIETSCDETAIALLYAKGGLKKPRFKVLKNIVSSQIETHRPWGGIVPNLAKREHIKNLPIVFGQVFSNSKFEIRNSKKIQNSKIQIPKIDIFAVTVGPGLEPCLWAGIEFAKEIHKSAGWRTKPKLIGVNHLEGHIYSNLLKNIRIDFPAVSLIVSGGHTILLYMQSLIKWQKLGETRDDAVGECFDKVARMLGLPFPGGPEIQKIAAEGNPKAINFPRPMINTKDYDFSFSGLKTSVLYYLRDIEKSAKNSPSLIGHHESKSNSLAHSLPPHLASLGGSGSTRGSLVDFKTHSGNIRSKEFLADICASFEQAAVDVLVSKTMRAARAAKAKSVMLSGGVAANMLLRKTLEKESKKIGAKFFAPEMSYNTDNAAMIGAAAYIYYLQKKNRKMTAQANLNL